MSNDVLERWFKFNAADLAANRGGQISPRQTETLARDAKIKRIIGYIFGGAALGIALIILLIGISGFLNFIGSHGEITAGNFLYESVIPVAMMVAAGGVGIYLVRRASRTGFYTLAKTEGRVKYTEERQKVTKPDHSETYTTLYYLHVGPRRFPVNGDLRDYIKSNDHYTLYYAQGEYGESDRVILSLESALTATPPADAPVAK